MSNFFFISKKNIQKNNFQFDSDESHHLINVMRLKIGAEICFTDGEGNSYIGSISSFDNDIVSGNILDTHNNKNELSYHIHLGLPVIKKSRIKIAIEKSVESGVKQITPLSLERSIRQNISIERLNSISKSAVKQSMRSIVPVINPVSSLSDWYDPNALNIACIIGADKRLSGFKDQILKSVNDKKKICLLIGPEGDFSNKEKEFIYDNKFIKVSLGNTILRTETAIISVLSILNELIEYE